MRNSKILGFCHKRRHMTQIYYLDIDRIEPDVKEAMISDIEKAEMVIKYNTKPDYFRSVSGWWLVLTIVDPTLTQEKIEYSKHGKPYVKGLSKHFNISHSGNIVVLAVSDSEVGVDVQLIPENISKPLLEKILSSDEIRIHSLDLKDFFTKKWTSLESYSKFKGLSVFNERLLDDIKKGLGHQTFFDITDSKNAKYKICVTCFGAAPDKILELETRSK